MASKLLESNKENVASNVSGAVSSSALVKPDANRKTVGIAGNGGSVVDVGDGGTGNSGGETVIGSGLGQVVSGAKSRDTFSDSDDDWMITQE